MRITSQQKKSVPNKKAMKINPQWKMKKYHRIFKMENEHQYKKFFKQTTQCWQKIETKFMRPESYQNYIAAVQHSNSQNMVEAMTHQSNEYVYGNEVFYNCLTSDEESDGYETAISSLDLPGDSKCSPPHKQLRPKISFHETTSFESLTREWNNRCIEMIKKKVYQKTEFPIQTAPISLDTKQPRKRSTSRKRSSSPSANQKRIFKTNPKKTSYLRKTHSHCPFHCGLTNCPFLRKTNSNKPRPKSRKSCSILFRNLLLDQYTEELSESSVTSKLMLF